MVKQNHDPNEKTEEFPEKRKLNKKYTINLQDIKFKKWL